MSLGWLWSSRIDWPLAFLPFLLFLLLAYCSLKLSWLLHPQLWLYHSVWLKFCFRLIIQIYFHPLDLKYNLPSWWLSIMTVSNSATLMFRIVGFCCQYLSHLIHDTEGIIFIFYFLFFRVTYMHVWGGMQTHSCQFRGQRPMADVFFYAPHHLLNFIFNW